MGCRTSGVEDAAGALSFTGTATDYVVLVAVSALPPSGAGGAAGTSDVPTDEAPAASPTSCCDGRLQDTAAHHLKTAMPLAFALCRASMQHGTSYAEGARSSSS